MPITVGMTGRAETTVCEENTARAVGSGDLPIFSTPMMAALMEQAACAALSSCLEPGESSVGTRLELSHDAATPVGGKIRAEAEITASDRRRITFAVRAYDGSGMIGHGTHERFLIQRDKFLAKCQARKEA